MIFALGRAARTAATIFLVGADHHLLEQRRRQSAGPAVEDLHRIGAGIDLADQMEGDTFPQNIQKGSKPSGSR